MNLSAVYTKCALIYTDNNFTYYSAWIRLAARNFMLLAQFHKATLKQG